MPYPLIVVTGDSIAQLSFQTGGYGAALIDQVSDPSNCGADMSFY